MSGDRGCRGDRGSPSPAGAEAPRRPSPGPRYLARAEELTATDTEDSTLNYGVVVDCGSSGSRVFVYFWPPHNGNPHDLLDIKQMRDRSSRPVVKKIKPGRCQPFPLPAPRPPAQGTGTAAAGAAGPAGSQPPFPGQASPWRRRRPRSKLRPTCVLCFASRQPTSQLRSTRKLRFTSCARQACGCCPRGEFVGPRWGEPGTRWDPSATRSGETAASS